MIKTLLSVSTGRRRETKYYLCRLIVVSAAISGCGRDSAPTRSADMEVVRGNPIEVAADTLWRARRIGEVFSDTTRSRGFGNVSSAVIASNGRGRIAVLDDIAGEVVLLDSTLEPVRRLGRRGPGPGEFRDVSGLGLGTEGTIGVFDVAKQSIVRFSAGGKALSEWRVPGVHVGGAFQLGDTSATVIVASIDRAGHAMQYRAMIIDSTGRRHTLTSVSIPLPKGIRLSGCPMPLVLRPVFQPTVHWAMGNGEIAWVDDASYTIHVVSKSMKRRIELNLPRRRATEQLASAALNEDFPSAQLRGACRPSPEAILRAIGYAKVIPLVAKLVLSSSGELWVQRTSANDQPGAIDVFDQDGHLLAMLPNAMPWPAAFVNDSVVLTIETDSNGAAHVIAYSLEK